MNFKRISKSIFWGLSVPLVFVMMQCTSSAPDWDSKNKELIHQYNLTERSLNLPESTVSSNLEAAQPTKIESIESVELYPGVMAKVFWGSGAMGSIVELQPNAAIPEEILTADRIMMVMEGEVQQLINGSMKEMVAIKRQAPDGVNGGTPRADFIYLEKGSKNAITAGSNGAKLLEVYSPLRLDYLQKAGVKDLPAEIADIESPQNPNLSPNKVYDLYDIQLTELAPGAFTRLISGKNMLLSFISMDPDSVFGHHNHPEEQMMMLLRGSVNQILLDEKKQMGINDLVRIPGNMVHGSEIGELGADVMDIFWPSRADYMEKEKEKKAAFHAIIPEDAKLELLIDGKKTQPELFFTEGPKWMNGKVYFSNMFFDKDFNADPKRSSTVEMDPDGTYRNITAGKMQTNGLYPYKNGNLIVCDMMGHQVVEMTIKGEVVRVLADKFGGKPIDGPNDVITDSKGGFYFTDPQFTMEPEKFQPGRAVYYVNPKGEISRITEPNEFAMPNGILLSPDEKTLYINNCYDKESWFPVQSEKDNFIWAYDVNEDGSVRNGRKFAKVLLNGEVLDRKGRSSGADGMAIDKEGNVYVATYNGVQIFNNHGTYVGMINLPTFPVSLCFGGDDMKTLFIVSFSKVYKIKTNKEGYVNYLE
ncbi:SMP-30/gluconolactonase/LRE family protein [Aquiflexum gelatinilyticum]|uniref:SMP-30/gluconolactonase/LRE family protein n=1 Tax=Aquiflexum gelatinilyticum TaxID=2961943 RepID=UPI002166E911|nr:SMP-30/gluconolactonase/LRE family protein [Aquiflexum gelatinilyticum]MCS4433156.1 SMP-30/gluconolactonase/LRE family protein [Aquiflexum gelatinilyticum]